MMTGPGLAWEEVDASAYGWNLPRYLPAHGQRFEFANDQDFLSAALGIRPRRWPRLKWVDHHLAHAASAYHASGFDDAAVLVIDGQGVVGRHRSRPQGYLSASQLGDRPVDGEATGSDRGCARSFPIKIENDRVAAIMSTTVSGKVIAMWMPIMLFVYMGFEHSVVNMYLFPSGLMLGGKFSIMDYLIWNELPTILGNLLGGITFVGLTLYATHVKTAPKRVVGWRKAP